MKAKLTRPERTPARMHRIKPTPKEPFFDWEEAPVSALFDLRLPATAQTMIPTSITSIAVKNQSPPVVTSLPGSFIKRGVRAPLIAIIPKIMEYPRERPTMSMLRPKKTPPSPQPAPKSSAQNIAVHEDW